MLKANSASELEAKAAALVAENKELEKSLEAVRDRLSAMRTKNMMTDIRHLNGVNVLTSSVDGMSADELKSMADTAKAQMTDGVVVFASKAEGKVTLVAMAMDGAVAKGVHCGNIIKEISAVCGGRGGGKPAMAQGGGTDASKVDEALEKAVEVIEGMIK